MPAVWSTSIESEGHGSPRRTRLDVSGEVDLFDETALLDAIDAALGEPLSVVVVDLSAVSFFDSSGVRVLVRSRRDHGERVQLGKTSPPVERILRIAGVYDLFADTEERAR
jgi:anti-sigma B factor antagonist